MHPAATANSPIPLSAHKIIHLLFHFQMSAFTTSCKLPTVCRTYEDHCFPFAPLNHICPVDTEVDRSCMEYNVRDSAFGLQLNLEVGGEGGAAYICPQTFFLFNLVPIREGVHRFGGA